MGTHSIQTLPLAGSLVLAATLALGTPASLSADQAVESMERSFTVAGRPEVTISNVDGRTRIVAGHEAAVVIRAVKEVSRAGSKEEAERAAAEVKVRIEQVGSRIEVEAQYPRRWFSFGWKPRVLVHFDVTMPPSADLEARSVDGSLEVSGISGRLQLVTVDGDLTGRDCSGRIDAHTVDGDLQLENARGEVKARTVDGELRVSGSLESVEVRSGDGDIEVDAGSGSRMTTAWSIRSADGDIDLRLMDGFAADVDIETGGGRITNDHPLTITGTVSEEHLSGKLYSGGNLLSIKSADGDIRIMR